MPLPERHADEVPRGGPNWQIEPLVAAAADLCRRPLRHGVVLCSAPEEADCLLRLEARSAEGERLPEEDLELELFASGNGPQRTLNLTLGWHHDSDLPLLWHGQHPVWMDPQGNRCERPEGGLALEALARRLRALLVDGG